MTRAGQRGAWVAAVGVAMVAAVVLVALWCAARPRHGADPTVATGPEPLRAERAPRASPRPTGPSLEPALAEPAPEQAPVLLRIALFAPDPRHGAVRAGVAFSPFPFLRADHPWPDGPTFGALLDVDLPADVLVDIARAEALSPDTVDDDPWRLLVAAEVERRVRLGGAAHSEEEVRARAAAALGLPADVDPMTLMRHLDADPEASEAFWDDLRATKTPRQATAESAQRVLALPDAPVPARDLAGLYVLEAAVASRDPERVAALALDLVASTDDPAVARQALLQMQQSPADLTSDEHAQIAALVNEQPDLLPYAAQLVLSVETDDRDLAPWVARAGAWIDRSCTCALRHDPGVSGEPHACQALCEQTSEARRRLLLAGALPVSDWRDRLTVAALSCFERAPLDALADGVGTFDRTWSWTGWPAGEWARCFEEASHTPPHPEGPLTVHVELVAE